MGIAQHSVGQKEGTSLELFLLRRAWISSIVHSSAIISHRASRVTCCLYIVNLCAGSFDEKGACIEGSDTTNLYPALETDE